MAKPLLSFLEIILINAMWGSKAIFQFVLWDKIKESILKDPHDSVKLDSTMSSSMPVKQPMIEFEVIFYVSKAQMDVIVLENFIC